MGNMQKISKLPKKVDWVALCEMYREYMEEISDHFYKLLQVQLKKKDYGRENMGDLQ